MPPKNSLAVYMAVATVVFNYLLENGAPEINAVLALLCAVNGSLTHFALGVVSTSALQSIETFLLRKADLFSRTPTRDLARLRRLANYIVVTPFCGGTLWNWISSLYILSKRFRPTLAPASHSIGHRVLTKRLSLHITHSAIRKTSQRQVSWTLNTL